MVSAILCLFICLHLVYFSQLFLLFLVNLFFNLFNTKIISICLFFAKSSLNLRVNFLTKVHYFINAIIKIILNAFFF